MAVVLCGGGNCSINRSASQESFRVLNKDMLTGRGGKDRENSARGTVLMSGQGELEPGPGHVGAPHGSPLGPY